MHVYKKFFNIVIYATLSLRVCRTLNSGVGLFLVILRREGHHPVDIPNKQKSQQKLPF